MVVAKIKALTVYGKIKLILSIIVTLMVIFGGAFGAASWIDNKYADHSEVVLLLDALTRSYEQNLNILNENIITLGNGFYDAQLIEIGSIIQELESRTELNATERAFIDMLKARKLALIRDQEILRNTQITVSDD